MGTNYNLNTLDSFISVNNIESLKRKKYKVGNIITVQNYYANDGITHKRIIANEDDGSGVLLNNGLWANIVHNGEIKISWLGITPTTLAENNKIVINKALKIKTLKNVILDTHFKCHEIEITKDIDISGNHKNTQQIYIKNEDNSKNTIIFKITGTNTYLNNFIISGGLNGIFSEEVDFNPRLENIFSGYCAVAGINHTPNEKYNQSGGSHSFCYSYMKNIKLMRNKYGMLLDHSKVPLRENWSNSNSIDGAEMMYNEVALYVKNMVRMECWQINNSDLSANNVGIYKPNITIEEYKNKIASNKYGAIILENCYGCDIELNSAYIEYSGDLCTVGDNSKVGNEIKTKGTSIYANSYEYQDVLFLGGRGSNSAIVSKNRDYAMFNLINCKCSRISCSNSWLTHCNDVIKTKGQKNENCFSTKNSNTMSGSHAYLNSKRGIFNLDGDVAILSISKETSPDKNPSLANYAAPYNIPYICEIGSTKLSGSYLQNSIKLVDISNFSNNRKIYEFLANATGFIEIVGECNLFENTGGYTADRYTSAFIIARQTPKATIIFDTTKSDKSITCRTGSLYIQGVTFKFKGNGKAKLLFNHVEYRDCIFDFSEFTGTISFEGNKQIFSYECYYTGKSFKISSTCIFEAKTTTQNFFWCDYRTSIPIMITSYPQGHGFNLNGIQVVRKGDQWVRASDGATQAMAEVRSLDTPTMIEKMKAENVYNDYRSYSDELKSYEKGKEEIYNQQLEAYNQYLGTEDKGDTPMTFEEFLSMQPMTLNLIAVEEPQPSEALRRFMDKYL